MKQFNVEFIMININKSLSWKFVMKYELEILTLPLLKQ